jgi:hypothetical protein
MNCKQIVTEWMDFHIQAIGAYLFRTTARIAQREIHIQGGKAHVGNKGILGENTSIE